MNVAEAIIAGHNWISQYLVQPLIVLLLGIFIGKIIEQVLLFVLESLSLRSYSSAFIAYMAKWLIYLITVLYALGSIGILGTILSFALGVLVVLLGLSFLLGSRDFLVNVASHHTVKVHHKPGSKVKTRFCEGTVQEVHLSETHIKTKEGEDIYIPNKTLAKS